MSKRFKSQDHFRFRKLGKRWRRPKGLQSKLRLKKGGAGLKVSIGYGTAGKELPTMIVTEKDFNGCTKHVLISSAVGSRKALILAEEAKKKGITVLNMKKVKKAKRIDKALKKKHEENKKHKEVKEEVKKEEPKKEENKEEVKKE